MSSEHYLIAKVEDAGFDVSKAKLNMVIQCIAGQLLTVPYAVANEIISITLGDTGVLKALSKITQSNYNEEEVSNLFDEVMARRSQEPQQPNNEKSIDVKAMAEEAIMECIKAGSFKKIGLKDFIDMIEYWNAKNEKGDVQLWIMFKDGVELKIDKKLSKISTYLAHQYLELEGIKKLDRTKLYLILKDLASDKYRPYSLSRSVNLVNLFWKTIIYAILPINTDVFCSCDSMPPKLYVRKSFFMERIAPQIADRLGIPKKDVPIVFKEWGIFLKAEPIVVNVPKCVIGPNYNGVIKDRYYEVDPEKLSEIIHSVNICKFLHIEKKHAKVGDVDEQ